MSLSEESERFVTSAQQELSELCNAFQEMTNELITDTLAQLKVEEFAKPFFEQSDFLEDVFKLFATRACVLEFLIVHSKAIKAALNEQDSRSSHPQSSLSDEERSHVRYPIVLATGFLKACLIVHAEKQAIAERIQTIDSLLKSPFFSTESLEHTRLYERYLATEVANSTLLYDQTEKSKLLQPRVFLINLKTSLITKGFNVDNDQAFRVVENLAKSKCLMEIHDRALSGIGNIQPMQPPQDRSDPRRLVNKKYSDYQTRVEKYVKPYYGPASSSSSRYHLFAVRGPYRRQLCIERGDARSGKKIGRLPKNDLVGDALKSKILLDFYENLHKCENLSDAERYYNSFREQKQSEYTILATPQSLLGLIIAYLGFGRETTSINALNQMYKAFKKNMEHPPIGTLLVP
jgi:hypothetical protein